MEPRISGDYAPQPFVTDSERAHPRYNEYARYRMAMASQLVTGECFSTWLRSTEEWENGRRFVFQATDKADRRAFIPLKWYVNVFPPKSHNPHIRGPFNTRAEAEAA